MKTYSPTPRDIERRWYVIDAGGAVLGRVASEAAKLLRGKHKPIFAPHMDTGDHVIVVNAGGVVLTGGKEESKVYYRHSGYPGGLRELGYSRLLRERPVMVVEKAVKGMLPKNRLGRQMFRKLSVYEGPDHPHQAQQPVPLALGEVPKWEGLPTPKPSKPKAKIEPKAKQKRAATRAAGSAGGTASAPSTAGAVAPRRRGGRGKAGPPEEAPASGRRTRTRRRTGEGPEEKES